METNHIVSLVSRLRTQANSLIVAELEKRGHSGLAPSHGAILHALAARGPLHMSALAEAIGKQKNTVTTLVNKLEQAGYVFKTPSPHDSRVTLVSLSAKAQAAQPDFEAISQTLLAAVWGDMPQAERETLVRGLEKVLRNISLTAIS
ncbi:MarR family transcriptional regulator [Desulfovibrio desulfuricans]|uniref:MarR family transcriptional regulator n=1 Tax=Desulfovibrio desulfuricans TaxID=876 RepID=A0A4P7UI82_DESDE|nr:MarR family transcriptional regulator [Desulfovibrio desulfuricans]QCC85247.1 MarR family transcriptional regulator [Desulfovibrio desulfuricans]